MRGIAINIIFLFFILLLASRSIQAQDLERPVVSGLPLVSDVQSTIEKARGYALPDDGIWIDAKNKIPSVDPENVADRKLGRENFESYEIREVLIEDKHYAALIIKYKVAEYEFPKIQEGFSERDALDFYVFPATNLRKILPRNVEFGTPYSVSIDALASGHILDYKNEDVNIKNEIATSVERALSPRVTGSANIVFGVFPIKVGGDKFIRFRLIRTYSNKYIYQNLIRAPSAVKMFSQAYYEVSFYKFKSFIWALTVLEQIKENQAASFNEFFDLAVLEYNAGDFNGALSDLNKAIRMDPNNNYFLVYAYRACAKHKLEKYDEALGDFNKAISLKPKDKKYQKAWAISYYNRAVTKYKMGNYNSACEDWHRAFQYGVEQAYDAVRQYCE
ncbi:MAG: hypothetical protein K9I94_06995 [Bacteroidales bacterium]|nr:hypothetical protein [Bacteroidales bacterium]